VSEHGDNAVDDLLDQRLVITLAHDPDDRLGAGGTHDQAAVTVEALLGARMAERTLAFSSGLPLL